MKEEDFIYYYSFIPIIFNEKILFNSFDGSFICDDYKEIGFYVADEKVELDFEERGPVYIFNSIKLAIDGNYYNFSKLIKIKISKKILNYTPSKDTYESYTSLGDACEISAQDLIMNVEDISYKISLLKE